MGSLSDVGLRLNRDRGLVLIGPDDVQPGSIVTIRAFDEYPEHRFEVHEVYDDLVTGYSLTGPLAGEYGEPAYDLIKAVQPT